MTISYPLPKLIYNPFGIYWSVYTVLRSTSLLSGYPDGIGVPEMKVRIVSYGHTDYIAEFSNDEFGFEWSSLVHNWETVIY